jgi:hypothetical protein
VPESIPYKLCDITTGKDAWKAQFIVLSKRPQRIDLLREENETFGGTLLLEAYGRKNELIDC